MYASVWVKDNVKQTVEDVISSDIAKFKAASPGLKVEGAESVKLERGKQAILKHFSSDAKDQNFEAIAYIDEGKTVVLVVLTSRTKKDFDSSLSAFRELVGSYMFLTDKVVIQK